MLSEYSPKNKQNHANHVHVDGDVDSESEDEEAEEDILDSSFIGDVVNEENRPPVTMVEVAVAPLRINGSLMLTQLIDELNKAFAGIQCLRMIICAILMILVIMAVFIF